MAFFIPKEGFKGNEEEKGSDAVEEARNQCNQCLIRGLKQDAAAFCPSCFTFLCQSCTSQHRQESQDHTLITDDFKLCDEYVNLKKQISHSSVQLTQTSNDAEKNIYLAELYRDKAFEEIQNERKKLNKLFDEEKLRVNRELDKFEAEIRNKILEKHANDSERFKSIKEETECLKTDLQALNKKFDSFQQTQNTFSATMATCQQQYKALKPKVKQTVSHNEVTKYRFEPKWEQNIQKMSITKFGHILTLDPEKATGSVIYKGDISLHSPSDREVCNIKGMCSLSTTLLVAADQWNNCLKILDKKQCKLVSTIPVPASPRDVTKIKGYQIAVTLPNRQEILIMSLSSDGSATHEPCTCISVSGACRGIVHNHGHLIVSFHFPTDQIQILDMKGTVTRTFATKYDPECQSNLENVGISPDHKLIYVADESKESVTCLTTSGKVKAIYKDPHFSRPRGIAITNNGLVYVAGKGKIHELTSDLSHGRIVMDSTHEIKGVQSLLYCKQDDVLYVGMTAQNVIKIFQIE